MGEIVLQIVATIPRLRRVQAVVMDVDLHVATILHLQRVLHAVMVAEVLVATIQHPLHVLIAHQTARQNAHRHVLMNAKLKHHSPVLIVPATAPQDVLKLVLMHVKPRHPRPVLIVHMIVATVVAEVAKPIVLAIVEWGALLHVEEVAVVIVLADVAENVKVVLTLIPHGVLHVCITAIPIVLTLALSIVIVLVKIMEGSANTIKELDSGWQNGMAKSITFIVTKDCQLACKYCYLVGKNTKERMKWEVAKKAIDYILEREDEFREESVVWDFIGGEPFLEIELIDKICDYLKTEMYRKNHHWFNSYRFSFSTNGINYHTEMVQKFIEKNRSHLSIGITIDGTKRKHDLNRIWKTSEMEQGKMINLENEKGSYDDVVKNIPLWLKQFPDAGTKVTISSPDIPYIKESVLHLYALGIKEVNINCVFEDVWKDGDDILFEEQLTELADAIIV